METCPTLGGGDKPLRLRLQDERHKRLRNSTDVLRRPAHYFKWTALPPQVKFPSHMSDSSFGLFSNSATRGSYHDGLASIGPGGNFGVWFYVLRDSCFILPHRGGGRYRPVAEKEGSPLVSRAFLLGLDHPGEPTTTPRSASDAMENDGSYFRADLQPAGKGHRIPTQFSPLRSSDQGFLPSAHLATRSFDETAIFGGQCDYLGLCHRRGHRHLAFKYTPSHRTVRSLRLRPSRGLDG